MLPGWVEDKIHQLGDWSLDSLARRWSETAVIGEVVSMYPPRSAERREVMALIAEVVHKKKNTQLLYARVWRCLKEGAQDGDVRIPQNIDPSTARCIIQHGGDYAVIAQADAESWTLAQARAWAVNRTVQATDKPPTLWKHLTKAIPPEMRKATGPISEGEFVYQVRQALASWNVHTNE